MRYSKVGEYCRKRRYLHPRLSPLGAGGSHTGFRPSKPLMKSPLFIVFTLSGWHTGQCGEISGRDSKSKKGDNYVDKYR